VRTVTSCPDPTEENSVRTPSSLSLYRKKESQRASSQRAQRNVTTLAPLSPSYLTFLLFLLLLGGPPREELPLPTQAPWTAFVGNLAFDVGEGEVSSFFTGLKVRALPSLPPPLLSLSLADSVDGRRLQLVSVKIINDMEGKPKGFGYVEFGTLDMLKEGLGRSGEVSFSFILSFFSSSFRSFELTNIS